MRIKNKILGWSNSAIKNSKPSKNIKKNNNNSNGYMHIATFAWKQLKT